MKPRHSRVKNSLPPLAIALCLAATAPLAHADEATSEGIHNFLSDPQRVGSLTGTILGGALTAHPVGTLAGSIIGFFVGKQTMHKSPEQQQRAQSSYATRSFIPTKPKDTAIPMLALETATPATTDTTASAQPAIPAVTLLAAAPQQPATEKAKAAAPVVVAALSSTPKMDNAPQTDLIQAIAIDPSPKRLSPLEQIASLCYGNGGQSKASNPDLQSLCYYHQSS